MLLLYPLHVAYQNPDQDLPTLWALLDLVRGDPSPWELHYPQMLTRTLRTGYAAALWLARQAGSDLDAIGLLAAQQRNPWPFRLPPRAIAIAAGLATLLVVHRLGRLVADGWTGLLAALLLGTSLAFVREHHHGMWDAPTSAALSAVVLACAVHVQTGSTRSIAAGGLLVGVAFAIKQVGAIGALPVAFAVLCAPGRWPQKLRRLCTAGAIALGVAFLLSPAVFVEHERFLERQRAIARTLTGELGILTERAPPHYGLVDALRNGVGLPLSILAALGIVKVAVRRDMRLLPLLSFVVAYGLLTWRSTLVLNRYVLPLVPSLAVLAAYALHGRIPTLVRAAVVAAVLCIDVPPTTAYLRLIAVEDTRVAAARWLREHVAARDAVFFSGVSSWAGYLAPALPRQLTLHGELRPELRAEIQRRMPPSFPLAWRFAPLPISTSEGGPGLRALAGAVVVTSEHDSPRFDRVVAEPGLIALLLEHGRLLADFPIERVPGLRVYEPGDLNFAPLSGADTLMRPGPRIRIWSVPGELATPAASAAGERTGGP